MFLCSCAKNDGNYDWAESIQKGNYEIISLGIYPYTTSQIRYEPEEFIEIRKKIENSYELLPQIVRHFYPEEVGAYYNTPLHFRYKFGATDKNKIILRYFAMRVPESEFAGYSIQFVFIDKEVREIYLFKTPLEK